MKVAAYGVGKNEESNIYGWYEGIKDADYILYLDTGSTDKTIEIAKSFGITVVQAYFSPWDENLAKNTALSLIPLEYEYCINLDIDQHMITKDWKEKILNGHNNKEILVCNLTSSEGLDDGNVVKKLFRIHKRDNCFWFGYRPEIKQHGYYPEESTREFIDITVKDMPGDNDRFENRESLYVNSFLNYVGKIKRYRHNQAMLSGLMSLALAYYEKDDRDNFNKIYKEIIDFIEEVESSVKVDIPDQYLITLAYTLFNPQDTSKMYKSLLEHSAISEYQRLFLNLRLLCIYFLTKNNKKLIEIFDNLNIEKKFFEGTEKDWNSYNLSGIELEFIDNFSKLIKSLKNNDIAEQKVFDSIHSLIYMIFANIGYGKRHEELAKNSFEYFIEHGYE